MTEQEKAAAIKELEVGISSAVSCLAHVRKVARDMGTLDLFPMFDDITVKNMLDRYDEIRNLRGY
jgi:hypothetical protein